MTKQTAVEWLVEQICGDHTEQWQKEIKQAKEMEKDQIIDAACEFMGITFDPNKGRAELYYNETYGSDK
jgi:hypothetical protein